MSLVDVLAGVVGREHVLTDPDLVAPYARDWTGRFGGAPACVVRPADPEQVAGVVVACRAAGVPLVPQGGNTGLVGGSVPTRGEAVLSLRRLTALGPVDRDAAQVEAGAGVTLAALQAHARAAGFAFAVEFAARDTATVGGLLATNAGGIHVLRHGSARAQVAGLEAVLADGSVVRRMSGVVKDNAGYDLPGLLVGSEGTLGIITAARLRLVPHLPERVTALVAVDGVAEALAVLRAVRAGAPSLEAAELLFASGLDLVRAHARLPAPFADAHPAYLLLECAGRADPVDELAAALDGVAEVRDVAVAQGGDRRAALWAYRERHTEAVAALGVVHKLDVALAARALAPFCATLPGVVQEAAPGATLVVWGHLGDGNLHVNVAGPAPDDERVDDAVLALVAAHGGSISAEHGIGTAKARHLGLTRTPEEISAMRAVKRALDPDGLLNPHAVLP